MKKPYIIAEMACAHDGSLDNARTIVSAASAAGANAIQFQIWKPKECVAPDHQDFELLKSIELGYDNWKTLIAEANNSFSNLEVIACVYGIESAKFAAENGVDVFKIHTSDVCNPVLIEKCAQLAKRIDLSVGGSLDSEIEFAINCIRNAGDAEIWLMYGIQLFPTPVEDVNLGRMKSLASKYRCRIGYQDHSDPESPDAYVLPAAAVCSGIDIVEKHITYDRAKKGIDSQAALNPDEFKSFVHSMKNALEMTLQTGSELTEGEKQYRQYSKKLILSAKQMPAGHVLTADDILFSRPATWDDNGLQPGQSNDVVGNKLKQDVDEFAPILKSMLSK